MTAHDARDYRERAEELRTNADNMVSQECARQLRRLADDYDRMAIRRETADLGDQQPKPEPSP